MAKKLKKSNQISYFKLKAKFQTNKIKTLKKKSNYRKKNRNCLN